MIEHYFPCPVGIYHLSEDQGLDQFNEWLQQSADKYENDESINLSLKGAIQTKHGFQVSFQEAPWESSIPGLQDLWKFVETSTTDFLQELLKDKKIFSQYIHGWAVRYKEGSFQGPHIHRNTEYTAVLYTLKDHPEGGNLLIHNPISASMYHGQSCYKEIKVEPGMLVILPGWLMHSVDPILKGRRNAAVFDLRTGKLPF
jgi:hypothetical protein